MDKIALTKRAIRIQAWEKMYEEYQSSGMKVKDWCDEQGLSIKTFYYRLKVLRQNVLNTQEQHDIVPIASSYNQSPEISKTETCAKRKIHISGNGITVELPVNISTELLAAGLKGVR